MNGIRVNFLTAQSYKAHCVTFPVRFFSEFLQEKGFEVKFYYHPDNPSITDCDVLLLGTESFGKQRGLYKPPHRDRYLEKIRPKVKTIIWLDMTDGSGTTWFGVMPYVDLYAKTQLLKDRSLYTEELYSGRLNSQYYHEQFGIEDSIQPGKRATLKPDDFKKLALFWNLGLGDNHPNTSWRRRYRTIFTIANYQYQVTPWSKERTIAVSYRASDHNKLATIAFQRQATRKNLAEFADETGSQIRMEGKLPFAEYKKEMSRSAMVASPFGLGETCPRDYDCFLAGAALLKPDMSHLETWPDYYVPFETYIPYSWDFSDIKERLAVYLAKQQGRLEIARKGQQRFLNSISAEGGEIFANHFANLIEKATSNS